MSENISPDVLNQLKATNGQVITCKAAVAWEAKKPLDITDIQVCKIVLRINMFVTCFHEFRIYELTHFSEKMSSFLLKELQSVFFVKINSFSNIF